MNPLKKANYFQEKVAKLNLEKITLKNKEFEDCQFVNCTFISTIFTNCKFINCQFKQTTLSAISLTNCSFLQTEFVDSKAMAIDWTKTKSLNQINFKDTNLGYSNFSGLNLSKIKMINCVAEEVDFSQTNLSESNLSKTNFIKARFFKNDLTGANFKKAKNYQINPRGTKLKDAHFSFPEIVGLLTPLKIKINGL